MVEYLSVNDLMIKDLANITMDYLYDPCDIPLDKWCGCWTCAHCISYVHDHDMTWSDFLKASVLHH